MKHVIIINPKAGVKNNLDEINKTIEDSFKDLSYEIYYTKCKNDATEFVKKYLEKTKEEVRFYSCGGDGTLNEIANGIVGFENASLACYPIGSGNDFVKYFGKVTDFLNFKSLINGISQKIDLLKFNNRLIVNILNIGLDANVVVYQRKFKKIPLISGKGAYNLGVVWAVLHRIANKCKLYIDNKLIYDGKMTLCAICNAKCYGGGYYCAPLAQVNDGLIDVCMVKKVSRITFTKLVKDYKQGKHLESEGCKPYIIYKQGKKVNLKLDKNLYYSIDGETEKSKDISVEIIPAALSFVVPKLTKD